MKCWSCEVHQPMSKRWLRCQRNDMRETMHNCLNESINRWISECMNSEHEQWTTESMSQRINESQFMQWIDEPTKQWTNEWMDGWVRYFKTKKIVTVRPRWFYTDCLWELADPGVASSTRSGPCAIFFSASKSKPYLCIIYMYMYIICIKKGIIYIYICILYIYI